MATRSMRVLFATDGSKGADAAATWLAAFPLPTDARALVLAVQELPPSPLDIPTVRDFHRALLSEARHAAARAATTLRDRFGTIEVLVVSGDPRQRIIDVADGWEADLIVVGSRGLGTIASALLGSVSLALARHAPCPVLVVRPTARPLHSIAVAFDGSPGAQRAMQFLAALPLATEIDVHLVGVVETPRIPTVGPGATAAVAGAAAKITDVRRRALESAIDRVTQRFDGLTFTRELEVGAPAETLARRDADLIVVGARGLGTLKRTLLGSVSEYVLRHAHAPVLIVRGGLMDRLARRRRRRARSGGGGLFADAAAPRGIRRAAIEAAGAARPEQSGTS